jgi:hypothetical protein
VVIWHFFLRLERAGIEADRCLPRRVGRRTGVEEDDSLLDLNLSLYFRRVTLKIIIIHWVRPHGQVVSIRVFV